MPDSAVRPALLGRVLVIDDEPDMVGLITEILSGVGFDVVGALNGGDGLMLEDFERPDVVLLDLTMPGIPGFDVLRHVRTTRPDVPVIIVSGQADHALTRATLDCGAVNYIPKPFDPDHLVDAVAAAALSRRPLPRSYDEAAAPPRQAAASRPGTDS